MYVDDCLVDLPGSKYDCRINSHADNHVAWCTCKVCGVDRGTVMMSRSDVFKYLSHYDPGNQVCGDVASPYEALRNFEHTCRNYCGGNVRTQIDCTTYRDDRASTYCACGYEGQIMFEIKYPTIDVYTVKCFYNVPYFQPRSLRGHSTDRCPDGQCHYPPPQFSIAGEHQPRRITRRSTFSSSSTLEPMTMMSSNSSTTSSSPTVQGPSSSPPSVGGSNQNGTLKTTTKPPTTTAPSVGSGSSTKGSSLQMKLTTTHAPTTVTPLLDMMSSGDGSGSGFGSGDDAEEGSGSGQGLYQDKTTTKPPTSSTPGVQNGRNVSSSSNMRKRRFVVDSDPGDTGDFVMTTVIYNNSLHHKNNGDSSSYSSLLKDQNDYDLFPKSSSQKPLIEHEPEVPGSQDFEIEQMPDDSAKNSMNGDGDQVIKVSTSSIYSLDNALLAFFILSTLVLLILAFFKFKSMYQRLHLKKKISMPSF